MKYAMKIFLTACFGLFLFSFSVSAQEKVDVHFFYSDTCPHCHKEQQFLDTLETIDLHAYEVTKNKENQELLFNVAEELDASVGGVPFTVISDQSIIGFHSAETTGKQIEQLIEYCQEHSCTDIVGQVIEGSQTQKQEIQEKPNLKIVHIPYIGEINALDFSLPVLSILLGTIDGFNPCAMWVLIFLITLLFGMEDKKRMWLLGGTFLFISGFVYFIFLAAWLNFFLFIGYIFWIRLIIGLVAVIGGAYHLKDWFEKSELVCKITQNEKRKKIFERIKHIISKRSLIWAILGISLLAFSVNLVELICSAGLPAIFTQVLALSDLNVWQYYGYILLYILMYMIDDIIVFTIAMITLEVTGAHSKYVRIANFIGGFILLILGILLIFKPEWLTFG